MFGKMKTCFCNLSTVHVLLRENDHGKVKTRFELIARNTNSTAQSAAFLQSRRQSWLISSNENSKYAKPLFSEPTKIKSMFLQSIRLFTENYESNADCL